MSLNTRSSGGTPQPGRQRFLRRLLALALGLAILVSCSGSDDDSSTATADLEESEFVAQEDALDEIPTATPFVNDEEAHDFMVVSDLDSMSDERAANEHSALAPTTTQAAAIAAEAAATGEQSATGSATTGSSGSPAPPIRISTPTCGSLSGATTRTAPFTGLQASIPSNLPAVVVKVSNNSSSSRASLIGLDQADIVFEQRIEDTATRFFSIFHSSLPANVGPVRSGRTTDIQLAQNLNNPIFGYSGSNDQVARQLQVVEDNGRITLYRNTDSSPFARDSRYSAPDNLFVSPAGLGACGSGNPTPIFSYGAANSGTGAPVSSVSFSARSSFRFDWDGSSFVRSQSGYTHSTREGIPLAPDNVVVLFVPHTTGSADAQSVDAETVGSGVAWTLRDGTITVGSYVRNRGGDPYTLLDGNGSAINLKAGQTWVVLAPAGTASFS